MDTRQGFVLTRHWRDTPNGTEVEFWLATDSGPRRIRLPPQPSVAFIAATLTGFVVVKWLLGYIKKHRFTVFAVYRILLGAALLLWLPAA